MIAKFVYDLEKAHLNAKVDTGLKMTAGVSIIGVLTNLSLSAISDFFRQKKALDELNLRIKASEAGVVFLCGSRQNLQACKMKCNAIESSQTELMRRISELERSIGEFQQEKM